MYAVLKPARHEGRSRRSDPAIDEDQCGVGVTKHTYVPISEVDNSCLEELSRSPNQIKVRRLPGLTPCHPSLVKSLLSSAADH